MYTFNLRLLYNQTFRVRQLTRVYPICNYATKSSKAPDLIDEHENSEPIKFTTSRAGKHKASFSRMGRPPSNRLSCEPWVILASFVVSLIYFAILREENDIDEELGRSLYSRIEGLEELQLRTSLKFNNETGKDATAILNRLREIEAEKQAKLEAEGNVEFQ